MINEVHKSRTHFRQLWYNIADVWKRCICFSNAVTAGPLPGGNSQANYSLAPIWTPFLSLTDLTQNMTSNIMRVGMDANERNDYNQ